MTELTGKSDFTEEGRKIVVEARARAEVAADRGGLIRETLSMAKDYTEARKDKGESELFGWILTNNPSITMKSSSLLNQFANGLWTSDHAGVLSVLKIPGGKKK